MTLKGMGVSPIPSWYSVQHGDARYGGMVPSSIERRTEGMRIAKSSALARTKGPMPPAR
jgi:hypothetical protein